MKTWKVTVQYRTQYPLVVKVKATKLHTAIGRALSRVGLSGQLTGNYVVTACQERA